MAYQRYVELEATQAYGGRCPVPSGCGENGSSAASGLLDDPSRGRLRRPFLHLNRFGRNAALAGYETSSRSIGDVLDMVPPCP